MSSLRSRSPQYSPRRHGTTRGHSRRFPWDEPDFDPNKVLAELDGIPHPREDFKKYRPNYREDISLGDERRSSPFPDGHQLGRRHYQDLEELYSSTPSLHHDEMSFTERSLSPRPDRGGDGDRKRGGFRKHSQSFERRGRSPHSPLRERSPPGMSWRRDQHGRGRGRPRGLNPRLRSEDLSSEGGRRDAQVLNRGRRTENPFQERPPPFKRHRREVNDASPLGFGTKEAFREQPYSLERPSDGFDGGTLGGLSKGGLSKGGFSHGGPSNGGPSHGGLSHADLRHSGPIVVDHDHGREQWQQFDLVAEFERQNHPRQRISSQEHLRNPDSRSDGWEDMREHHVKESWRDSGRECTRNPVEQNRTNPLDFLKRNGPLNRRGRSGSHPLKGRFGRGRGERPGAGPPRSHPRFPQFPQRYHDTQDLPNEQHRQGYRPPEEDFYEGPVEEEPNWEEEGRLQQWEPDRPESLEQRAPRDDLDSRMPRQRQRGWSDRDTEDMAVAVEETLTIKVDMSRPVKQNSLLYYSSDRQLSLDLVNVGRQRLDFLPMLEHSGTYRESSMHTGTFAQEIITLVHHVKEQYFGGDGITLNERFSASQQAGSSEDGGEEMTLDERFSSNRGFSLNMNTLMDDEPLFSRLGPMQTLGEQPVRGPGDLRHDLEKRRQERLEGVKVTIRGGSRSQHPPSPMSERNDEYGEKHETAQGDGGGFSSWSDEDGRRRGGNMGLRSGGYRPNTGPQRRNNRIANRLGPMRRQSNHSHAAGASW